VTTPTEHAPGPALRFARRAAPPFGLFAIGIETWRRWHQFGDVRMWPVIFDDYLMGGFLLAASLVAARSPARGRTWLAGAWGVATGMMYGSFFLQLGNPLGPDPSGFPLALVLLVKGIMLATCVSGLVTSVISAATSSRAPSAAPPAP
jgi:hypothetical protein